MFIAEKSTKDPAIGCPGVGGAVPGDAGESLKFCTSMFNALEFRTSMFRKPSQILDIHVSLDPGPTPEISARLLRDLCKE